MEPHVPATTNVSQDNALMHGPGKRVSAHQKMEQGRVGTTAITIIIVPVAIACARPTSIPAVSASTGRHSPQVAMARAARHRQRSATEIFAPRAKNVSRDTALMALDAHPKTRLGSQETTAITTTTVEARRALAPWVQTGLGSARIGSSWIGRRVRMEPATKETTDGP